MGQGASDYGKHVLDRVLSEHDPIREGELPLWFTVSTVLQSVPPTVIKPSILGQGSEVTRVQDILQRRQAKSVILGDHSNGDYQC